MRGEKKAEKEERDKRGKRLKNQYKNKFWRNFEVFKRGNDFHLIG